MDRERGYSLATYAKIAVKKASHLRASQGGERIFTFAESCTGGLVAAAATSIPGASDVFPGSLVTYSSRAKIEQLGVLPETLRDHGAVSGECAAEMAYGAMRAFSARIAIAVTGIAGPGGGTPDKPVGTVWFAGRADNGELRLIKGYYPGRSRQGVRVAAATAAMRLLALMLDDMKMEVFADG